MSNLKVGDKVRCIANIDCSSDYQREKYAKGELKSALEIGKTYLVTEYKSESYGDFVSVVGNGIVVNGIYPSMFEKIECESFSIVEEIAQEYAFLKAFQIDQSLLKEFQRMIKSNESMTQKVSKTMSSIMKKIKDIKLSQEDRLLRKHDFENENGAMTFEAKEMMSDELLEERWAKRRLEIAADLKLIEQSEK